jgi:hypothetical protein
MGGVVQADIADNVYTALPCHGWLSAWGELAPDRMDLGKTSGWGLILPRASPYGVHGKLAKNELHAGAAKDES